MQKTIFIPKAFRYDQINMGGIEYFNAHIRGKQLKVVSVQQWFTTVEDEKGNMHTLHGYFKGDIFQLLVTKYQEVDKLTVLCKE